MHEISTRYVRQTKKYNKKFVISHRAETGENSTKTTKPKNKDIKQAKKNTSLTKRNIYLSIVDPLV